ncbi:MAG: RnfABCDGE type electron transport complex subunit D [Phycisphaerae bacterium]|nr:RnfABCDGE type electron transport complex subunit D [Phycisphaerae bacterium]
MTDVPEINPPNPEAFLKEARTLATHAPLLRAPEKVHSVFLVIIVAACLPLAGGVVLFGWRALWVVFVSVVSCAVIEKIYFRVTHTPALLGRTHAYLTGVLLALTLPPFTPWYVVVLGALFSILVGKAIFGGVGHFLWQPALVGRFAIAVITPILAPMLGTTDVLQPLSWGVLDQQHIVFGDVKEVKTPKDYRGWKLTDAPDGTNGFAMPHPNKVMSKLWLKSDDNFHNFSSIGTVRDDIPNRQCMLFAVLPPVSDMLFGARPGGIGETCSILIIAAGLYLVYRNYVKWQLPVVIILSAAIVVSIAPIRFTGPNGTMETVWFPMFAEGIEIGFTYVLYQLLGCGLLVAAFFMAPEMTTSPVTTGGQVIFGIGCGSIAMLMKLYMDIPIPAYVAVLVMNTFVPTIDSMWQPKVFGQKHFPWLARAKK